MPASPECFSAAGLAVSSAQGNLISDIKVKECLPEALRVTLESLLFSFIQERGGKIQPMNFKLHTTPFTSDLLSRVSPKILLQSFLETKCKLVSNVNFAEICPELCSCQVPIIPSLPPPPEVSFLSFPCIRPRMSYSW